MVDWLVYLARWMNDIAPGTVQEVMYVVGAVEILVALKSRYGGYVVVVAWLGAIIVNVVTLSGYYDVALRNFGLTLGALSLARLPRCTTRRCRAYPALTACGRATALNASTLQPHARQQAQPAGGADLVPFRCGASTDAAWW